MMIWMPEHEWVAILAVLTSIAVGWAVYRVARTKRETKENLVPSEVREHSHAVANEATALRGGLRRIAHAADPLKALVDTVRQHKQASGG